MVPAMTKPEISREDSERMLTQDGLRDGSFLIRRSTKYRDCYVLVVAAGGRIRHYPVELTQSGSYTLIFQGHQRFFDSVNDVVEYYSSHHDLPVMLKNRLA